MYNVYSTFNNNLCWSIVKSCCYCKYDLTVKLIYDNKKKLSEYLFYRLFDFVYHRGGLKEYYNVLLRLPDKDKKELESLQMLSKLMQEYKMKGGVLK